MRLQHILAGLALVGACASRPATPPAGPAPAPPPVVAPLDIRPPNAEESGPLHVGAGQFLKEDGSVWIWRGITDFRLLKDVCDGQDITAHLDQDVQVGANIVRVLGMAHNLFDLNPETQSNYWDCTTSLVDQLAARGLRIEFVVFADAQFTVSDLPTQRFHFANVLNTLGNRWNVVLELCNECSKNGVDPSQFTRPQGFNALVSHGSGLTDTDTVQPRWDWAGYHARRDGARGFTNYGRYEFQAAYPPAQPLVPDEGAKPQDYGFDTRYAYFMGLHARTGDGGTFHTQSGVAGALLSSAERDCAQAFFRGVSR